MGKYIILLEHSDVLLKKYWENLFLISSKINTEIQIEFNNSKNQNNDSINIALNAMQGILNEINRNKYLSESNVNSIKIIYSKVLNIINSYFNLLDSRNKHNHIKNYIIIKKNDRILNYYSLPLRKILTLDIKTFYIQIQNINTFKELNEVFKNSIIYQKLCIFYKFLLQNEITCYHNINNIDNDLISNKGNSLKIILQSFVRAYIEIWGCNVK